MSSAVSTPAGGGLPRPQRLDPSGPAHANRLHQVEISAEDLDILLRLRAAGLLNLDGLDYLTHNPRLQDWTYEAFHRHMRADQDLRPKTARCRVRYVSALEEGRVGLPVELRPPSEQSWLEHVYDRREDGATGSALNHYRKALRSLFRFLGTPEWPCLLRSYDEPEPQWTLPADDLVRQFWTKRLSRHPYTAATYAHIFHFGFHVGVRPPSEICALDVDDVDFDAGRIVITEVKKGDQRRAIEDLEPFVLTAHNSKSLWNYYTHHRPKVDRGRSRAFWLNHDGRRYNPDHLRTRLAKAGRKIWPEFCPYTMRRWFATQLLVASGLNVYVVADRLGDTVATVERHYLDRARARTAMRGQYHLPRLRGGASDGT